MLFRSAVRLIGPRRVELKLARMRCGYVHEVTATGLRDTSAASLLHPTGYYTLQAVPAGG